jgi:hypothetical protein
MKKTGKIVASGAVAILLAVITASHALAYFVGGEDDCLDAGTLALRKAEPASQVYTFAMSGVLPEEEGCTSVEITNDGALDGELNIMFSPVINKQNG